MTLPMDIRLASTSAKIGFVFARRGIVPEACSSWFLPRLVGISQALEWCYSGRVFSADEALAGGLVRSVHQPDDLLPGGAGDRCRDRRQHRARQRRPDTADDVGDADRRPPDGGTPCRLAGHTRTVDAARMPDEGVESFLEKRPAVFTDRVSDGVPDVFPEPLIRKFS